jgi:hypothetical protein
MTQDLFHAGARQYNRGHGAASRLGNAGGNLALYLPFHRANRQSAQVLGIYASLVYQQHQHLPPVLGQSPQTIAERTAHTFAPGAGMANTQFVEAELALQGGRQELFKPRRTSA